MAQTVAACGSNDDPGAIAATLETLRPTLHLTQAEVERALDAEHFVRVRNVIGGPAPDQAAEALVRAQAEQRRIEEWVAGKTAMLDQGHAALQK